MNACRPAHDRALFTLRRMPEDAAGRRRAEHAAERLRTVVGDGRIAYGAAGRALGVSRNALRYGTTTGTIAIRWDGARQPIVWMVPHPDDVGASDVDRPRRDRSGSGDAAVAGPDALDRRAMGLAVRFEPNGGVSGPPSRR